MIDRVIANREKTIFWSLLGILVLSACFYMYFINTTVKNVVASQNIESQISKINLSISNKEFEYIKSRNAITLNLAYNLGFKDVSAKSYINEKSTKGVSFLSH